MGGPVAATGFLAHFIRQIELYLTGVGLLVILVVPQLFAESSRMLVMAITAIGVGVVHGVLFWLVRRRQRLLRAEVLADVQRMLKDRINNKLQIVLMHAVGDDAELSGDDRAQLEEVTLAAKEVAQVLNHLSTESLTSWQSRYREVLAGRPNA